MLIGGLDIGTTGCKLSVYDEQGSFVCNSYKEYEIRRRGGEHEIDASTIFGAVCDVIRTTLATHQLAAIGVTSFGETFVALDERDEVLLPAMLYTDPRGEVECDELCAVLGKARLIEISGTKPHSMYSLPKMMWIKKNLPETYEKIKHITLMGDYIVYMLSGNACIDYSLAARTMALDIRKKEWSKEILSAAGIDASLLSKPVPTGSLVGTMKPELARELGATNEISIVIGAHDQVATTVGAGILEPGEAVDGTGTVECIVPIFNEIPTNEELYNKGYAVVPYALDGTYACYAFSFTGGAVLKWFRDHFTAQYEGAENIYAELDRKAPTDPTGILVLPHFAGAATPYMDNGSKAAIVGLTLEHGANDLYRALMEGVTYEMMLNVEQLERFGIVPTRLYATGGGANSDVWLKIKADVLNRPITALSAKEVGAAGTCMLTGVAIGLYRDLREAKSVFVKERKTYAPDAAQAEAYRPYYKAYREMYNAVRPIVEVLNEKQ